MVVEKEVVGGCQLFTLLSAVCAAARLWSSLGLALVRLDCMRRGMLRGGARTCTAIPSLSGPKHRFNKSLVPVQDGASTARAATPAHQQAK